MGKKLKIDFTDTDTEIRKSGRSARVPEGEYLGKINNHDVRETKDGSGRWIQWEVTITKPTEFKGKLLRGGTSLKKDALWSLRNLIHAATGKNVAGKVANFDPESIHGKIVGFSVSDNEYEDKDGNTRISSQIDSFFPKDEVNLAGTSDDDDDEEEDEDLEEEDEEEEEEDDEEEEEKPKKKKKSSKKRKKDEDDDEDEDDEDLEDVDVEDI